MAKKETSAQNTEEKIFEVATELFAQNGFEGTSTRDICTKAGVNISLISYYFGGKEELYRKIVNDTVEKIINHMKTFMPPAAVPDSFDNFKREEKIELFLMIIEKFIEYFYSENVSNYNLMILFREQITANVDINPFGYSFFKRLLASIIGKDENDKEVILRSISIAGQIHSARILSQFSLKLMNQTGYSKEDIQMLKHIIIGQTKSILEGIN